MFHNSFGLNISLEQVVKELIDFMKDEPEQFYKIIIGTDSQQMADKTADFVTAVVIHRLGCGGRYFWRKVELGKFYNLRERMIKEVLLSLEIAKEVLMALKKFTAPNFDFEIHADIGQNGETRVLIQEVVNIIRSYNFKARVKPESYAATKVADRHV